MKYLIGNQCLNSDNIVSVEFDPARDKSQKDSCCITLTSSEPVTNRDGDTLGCSQSIVVNLRGQIAYLFWESYISDAYAVVNP